MKQALLFTSMTDAVALIPEWFNIAGCVGQGPNHSTIDPTDVANTVTHFAAVMPMAGTLKNLYIEINADNGTAGHYILTLYKNGAATPLSISHVPGGGGAPILVSDTVNTVVVAPGDLIALLVDLSTTITGNTQFTGAMEFDPT